MIRRGQEITVVAEELVPGGAAMAHIEGMPVFVPKLFPGDQARIGITEAKRGFARGVVLELLAPGPLRRAAPCPVAESCGGCDWTALRLDHQLEAKQKILLESLRRVGKLDAASIPQMQIHSSPLNYRLRSRLQVQDGALGFFAMGTHRVVPLPAECEVVGPAVIGQLPKLRDAAERLGDGEIETLESDHEFSADPARQMSIEVREFRYELSGRTFFQVNRHLLSTLIGLVQAAAECLERRNTAWDLFAGVGFFTLPLGRIFGAVTGVEESLDSHRLSLGNVAVASNVSMVNSSVESFLQGAPRRVDFILVDPPRAGLSPRALGGISETAAGSLAYLSCDPVTFSRDASRLSRRGWTLISLDLIDLFPNTHHVETFASFRRDH